MAALCFFTTAESYYVSLQLNLQKLSTVRRKSKSFFLFQLFYPSYNYGCCGGYGNFGGYGGFNGYGGYFGFGGYGGYGGYGGCCGSNMYWMFKK